MTLVSRLARQALVTHLRTRLATHSLAADAVLDGWPAPSVDLPRPVAVSVSDAGAVDHHPTLGAPEIVRRTPEGDTSTRVLVRTGTWTIPLSVDVWTASAVARDTWTERVWAALNEPPSVGGAAVVAHMSGLALSLADYHGAVALFDGDGWTAVPNPDDASRESHRTLIPLTARVDELTERVVPRLVRTTLDLTLTTR